ncbi:YeeE/YedE thiosulfate transporter family protein [Bifidobacterium aesculapii]|uniref:YeeE/YedE thiosulfate transporter family protein n=1 Tax=Bifidobacterium aesculapii TaxID=1329411 RepID=UPI0009EB247F|nr:YeeE/YedE thiosulfate transporter family protein [Bifidobacterium aesculapii]
MTAAISAGVKASRSITNPFARLGQHDLYKKLLKEPLTYVTGAVLLAILQISSFAVLGKGWGVTSAFTNWGAWIYQAFGGDPASWAYFASEKGQKTISGGFLQDGGSIEDIGVVVGALIAILLASQFRIRGISDKRQLIGAILGGLFMGYGARMAQGCNIGALFTGISALSLSGWVFFIFLFLGAIIGGKILSTWLVRK